jgi:hypothetical protein
MFRNTLISKILRWIELSQSSLVCYGPLVGFAHRTNLSNPATISLGAYGDSEAEANARLIAAAPDLLAQLRWAEAQLASLAGYVRHECKESYNAGMASISAALAKAEGRTN